MIELVLEGYRFSVEGVVTGLTIVTPTQRVCISITPSGHTQEVPSPLALSPVPAPSPDVTETILAVPPAPLPRPLPAKGVPVVAPADRAKLKMDRSASDEVLKNWRVAPRQIIQDTAEARRLTVPAWVESRVPRIYRAAFYKWWESAEVLPADVQRDLCALTRFSCWDGFPDDEVVPKFLGRQPLRMPIYQRLAANCTLSPESLATFFGIYVSAIYLYRRKYVGATNG